MKKFVENANHSNDPSVYQNKIKLIYKCFASWIEERLIEPNLIVNSQLLATLFQIFVRFLKNIQIIYYFNFIYNNKKKTD